MEIYEFDHELVQEKTQMFPDEICDDLLTAYHGTSSIFEDDIDSLGLQWQPHVVRRTEVDAVVSIFEEMNWDGVHRGGIAVLKPFSQEFDFGCSHTKPIFLAESSYRGSLFATRDYAGGETMRALRHCFDDLLEYLNSEELRNGHITKWGEKYRRYGEFNVKIPTPVSLEWLRSEMEKLEELITLCREAFEKHRHGILYAVQFTESNVSLLKDGGGMGLIAGARIPPENLIGKVRVPRNWKHEMREDNRQMQAMSREGLVGQVRARERG